MLTIPSFQTWHFYENNRLIETAPACGLYFAGLNYKPEEDRTIGPPVLAVRGNRIKSFLD